MLPCRVHALLAGGVWGQTPRPSAHVPRMMTQDGLGFPLWAPGLKSKPGTPHSTASRRGKERWSPSDRGGRGSEAWPAAACPRQETPRCFLCPVAATRGLAPAEPNACVCFCGAVHTWGMHIPSLSWGCCGGRAATLPSSRVHQRSVDCSLCEWHPLEHSLVLRKDCCSCIPSITYI